MKASTLLVLAGLLIVIWVIASVTRFLVGVALNLLLLAAVILVIVWAIRRVRGRLR